MPSRFSVDLGRAISGREKRCVPQHGFRRDQFRVELVPDAERGQDGPYRVSGRVKLGMDFDEFNYLDTWGKFDIPVEKKG